MIPSINIKDYNYPLPEERIAKYPLPRRDSSKLLEYKDGTIRDHVFTDLPSVLPQGALVIFNDTKVVPARLHFQRETGAIIEIFCLEPVAPCEYNISFASTEQCSWKCIVGNVKKWKGDTLSLINPQCDKDIADMALKADLVDRDGATATVRFTWQGGLAFSKVLEFGGNIPIPPYLNRETESI
ncbi:MAG: S-adenosylmethionine:tRNA ribosyltransferase-isomerase, partial [Bacteroidales bacterium]|nr:S-adenosylmethionine:tRNA ribosyltransferase-isomerase [Bacteroidales bacterium]